jgi:hypothetical protein
MPLSLQFSLEVEDEWPPVGSESLPFEKVSRGYKCLSVPLFVRELSVGDVIAINQDEDGFVNSWSHLQKSERSTIWLLRLQDDPPIKTCLNALRSLQCNTTGVDSFGCYAVDVPPSLPMSDVDGVLEMLDSDLVAIAFPSMRHVE